MASRTSSKVTSAKVAALYDAHVLKNYGPAPMALVRGDGSYAWDAENRRYLDFSTGIAVNTLGHCHPKWVERVREQAGKLVHVSNLFHIPQQGELAARICAKAGNGKVFFCNSGAEANEFLIKLARLHGRRKSGGVEGKCFKVIAAENSFHGRTFGGMSATPQAKVQDGFAPLLEGFLHGKFNDVESFRALVDESVAAILLETVQGEGGIHPATTEFLKGIRKLCDEHGLLLLIDEVQCGIGRTGRFFAFEHMGIQPDAIGMAKGLGGGFPIGAAWVGEAFADLFTPGSHGTTFGGNPLACAAALAVLEIMEEEALLEKVARQSVEWHASLKELVARHPAHLAGFRGIGYHAALVANGDPLPWVGRLRENGLLVVRGGTDAIRLMPPLNVSSRDLATAVEIIDFVMGTHTE
jgi:acetylornithine aminotransferase/acetylornithine/N-succinyldiaminopimelate aminotransferase